VNETALKDSNRPESVYGEIGLWMAILADLVIFTLMFATVLYYRGFNPELYTQSQVRLDQFIALINTLLLLTSSIFVVFAVHAARVWNWRVAGWMVYGAIACGLGFVGMKFIEYGDKFDAGITMQTNEFFMFYFMTTFLHLVHVVIGLGVLFIIRLGFPPDGEQAHGRVFALEAGGVFWHMVDLLWVILMAVVYLAR
jgi:nitric oxide reductase NorE protein